MIRVGISGWRYAGWRGTFYPQGLVQRRELEYAAERMTSVEVNGSFYSLQRPSSWRTWSAAVPADFVFAVKGPRCASPRSSTPSRTPEFCELLRAHGIGMVVADSAGTWPMFDEVTANLVYVRLHGDEELYASGYGEEALARWADKVRAWDASGLDVYVYFDNDMRTHAPFDAMALEALLRL